MARGWLETERANLVAIAAHAAAHGWPNHASHLARTLFRFLDTGAHRADALTVHSYALRAARKAGDHAAEGHALNSLGLVYWRWGRYQEA